MPNLISQIENDFQKAFKKNQKEVYETLRMIKSVLKNARIAKKAELSDAEVKEVLTKEMKKREEALTLYRQAKRDELVKKEEFEIRLIKRYLPPQLSREEIEELVKKTIKELRAESKKDLGKVMGKIMPEVKGRADGKIVSEIVNKYLK